MAATAAVPSASSTACGVSTWISNRNAPSASPYADSSRAQMSTIAVDLGDRGHLGQGDHPAGRQLAPVEQRPQHQVKGAQTPAPGGRLQ